MELTQKYEKKNTGLSYQDLVFKIVFIILDIQPVKEYVENDMYLSIEKV